MADPSFEKYARVCDAEGFKGTIMYIGPVAAAKNKEEIWLGIQWDKADRGKNDGSCVDENGVQHRYFECPQGSGSFVKVTKVSTGDSLVSALQKRYVKTDAPIITDVDGKLADSFVLTSKGNQKSIEFVGEMKIRKYQQIEVVDKVVIRNDNISSIGDGIIDLAGHFKEIDLQDNLLYKWSDIASLASQLQQLSSILLHGNKFQPLARDIVTTFPPQCFEKLVLLALNCCNIKTWQMIDMLRDYLPNIEELYLAGNNLSDIPKVDIVDTNTAAVAVASDSFCGGFSQLRILDLCGCELDDWTQVAYFGKLSNIQELLIDSNPIPAVAPWIHSLFDGLQRISLSATRLDNWNNVDALATYPSIRQLRLSQIPLFAGKGASEVRPKVIARMKQLAFFNGSGISPRERTDAEKSYLRTILREIEESKRNSIEYNVQQLHPRYDELNSLYGMDLLPVGRVNENLSMAADMINVTFKNMTFSTGGTLEPIPKKIPSSVTIARLRMMVKQMIGLDMKVQQLSIRVYKDSPPTLLDDDQSTLQYYGAIDGAEIFINESKE